MSKRTYLLATGILIAIVVAPLALAAGEGGPVLGGKRNPTANASQAYTAETEIIANTSTYGTRQSNKSNNGGGAIYGCRSGEGGTAAKNEPCIRANNLERGLAFEFATGGLQTGSITAATGGDTAKPFTTNATGVATGLNADRVDSKSADDIVKDAATASNAARPFAQVAADGTRGATRGVTSAGVIRQGIGDYDVTFDGDLSACALSAVIVGTLPALITVTPVTAADKRTTSVDVRTVSSAGLPSDRGFHLSASC